MDNFQEIRATCGKADTSKLCACIIGTESQVLMLVFCHVPADHLQYSFAKYRNMYVQFLPDRIKSHSWNVGNKI